MSLNKPHKHGTLSSPPFFLSVGFRKSRVDPSLFIYNHNDTLSYLLVYVYDLVLNSNNNSFLDYFIASLAKRFSIKDLGSLPYFLGVEVIPIPNCLFLSQHRHIQDLFKYFHMDGMKEAATR